MQSLQGVFVLTVLCVVSAFGQKPDFTGTWKQVDISGRVRIDKIHHQDGYLKIAVDSRDVAVIMSEEEYRTDGSEQVDSNANGRQRWRTVGWQGSVLVFLTVVKDGYHVGVTRESWTLTFQKE